MAKAQRLYYHDNEARSPFITIDNEFDIGGHLPLSKSRRIFCREQSRKEKKLMAVMNIPAGQVPGVRRAGFVCIVLDVPAFAFIKITRVLMFLLVEKSIRTFLNNRASPLRKVANRENQDVYPLSSNSVESDINR